jgi:hypothetical protein
VISLTRGGSVYKRLLKAPGENYECTILENSNGRSIIFYLPLNTHSFIMQEKLEE